MCYFHSMMLEIRCQVHSELAGIEEEEGRLEASFTHLQKAMQLDNGSQRERLSSALHLLQLRGTLYQTPDGTEDKALMLMQQVFRHFFVRQFNSNCNGPGKLRKATILCEHKCGISVAIPHMEKSPWKPTKNRFLGETKSLAVCSLNETSINMSMT